MKITIAIALVSLVIMAGIGIAQVAPSLSNKNVLLKPDQINNIKEKYNIDTIPLSYVDNQSNGKYKRCLSGISKHCSPWLVSEAAMDKWMEIHLENIANTSRDRLNEKSTTITRYGEISITEERK